jgi:hypothetical protein
MKAIGAEAAADGVITVYRNKDRVNVIDPKWVGYDRKR